MKYRKANIKDIDQLFYLEQKCLKHNNLQFRYQKGLIDLL